MAKAKTKTTHSLKSVLGPLWSHYSKASAWEIIIDSFSEVYLIENLKPTTLKVFKNESELEKFISALFKFTKRKLVDGEYSYYMKLDEYTLVNIVLPPVAMKGPSVVISKLPSMEVTLEHLIEWKALTEKGRDQIHAILNSNRGFLVAGNIGSGKTTLLNTLIHAIPQPNRVVTLERTADLVIKRPFVCRLQPQSQKADEMISLIEAAEHMRADYVVLSNSSGPEIGTFLEMVRNNCTGVMMMTAVSVMDAVNRLETKVVLSSDGLSLEEARYAIAQTLPYLIFQEKRADGKRVLSSIQELVYEGGDLKLKELYKA